MHRSTVAKLVVLVALAVADSRALAQGVTGSAVTGTIRDPDGAPVPGAKVQLQNPATGEVFNTVTGGNGQYFIDNVPAGGPYRLAATAEGYDVSTKESAIQLTLGQRLTVDLALKYAGEEMEILSHLDALDDKARSGPSTLLKEATINRLPLQGRNFTNLISVDPRVTSTSGGPSIAGQNNRLNNIQIDGGANNDLFGLADNGTPGGTAGAKPLSIEAIKEFNVQVAPFDVRLGNFVGGLVNAVTKSGTNDFHGALFGYYQNKNLAGFREDPTFTRYYTGQFGAAVGGPIIKDKAHFFIATDIQQRQSAYGNSRNLTGDDTYDSAPSHAGFTVAIANQFQNILAKPAYSSLNAGTPLGANLANPDRNLFVKVTANPLENSRLELSYNFVNAHQDVLDRSGSTQSGVLPTVAVINGTPTITSQGNIRGGYQFSNAGYTIGNTTNTVRGKLTSNFNEGKVSNEFLAGVSIIRDAREIPSNAPLIMVRAAPTNADPGSGWISVGGERFSQANQLDQDVYQLQDNVSFAAGQHRLVVGTSNEYLKIRNLFLQAATGAWVFNSLADFDAGTPVAFQRRLGVPGSGQDPGTAKFNATQLGFYLQDEWSVLRNLTITPGIRVDLPLLSKANTNQVVLNSPTLPIDTSQIPSGNLLWSPRLGFNWDVDGSADTIVRGGVGVFSGRPAYVWVANAYTINGLSQIQLTCTGPFGVPTFTTDPNNQPTTCPVTPPGAQNQGEIDYFDPKTKYPQNLRFALGADRRLPFGIVASADLLYTQDINGWYITDENLAPTGNTSAEGRTLYGNPNATNTALVPNRLDIQNLTNAIKISNKNGGKVYTASLQLQKQFGQDLELSVGYTYSRSYDLVSLTSSQALSNFQFSPLDGDIQNRNVRPSAFDRPHHLVLTGSANLPYGFGLGLSYTYQQGTPYTWVVNGDANGDGQFGNDPVYVPPLITQTDGSVIADSSKITLVNANGTPAAPATYAALGDFVNGQDCLRQAQGSILQRGACRNPWSGFVDMRVTWVSPKIKGEQQIEVQWDIFNVMNLINKNWGHLDSATGFETISGGASYMRASGWDAANNRPKYVFVPQSSVVSTSYSPTLSRWRMQLGARYVF
jgi:hypothetical protein